MSSNKWMSAIAFVDANTFSKFSLVRNFLTDLSLESMISPIRKENFNLRVNKLLGFSWLSKIQEVGLVPGQVFTCSPRLCFSAFNTKNVEIKLEINILNVSTYK